MTGYDEDRRSPREREHGPSETSGTGLGVGRERRLVETVSRLGFPGVLVTDTVGK